MPVARLYISDHMTKEQALRAVERDHSRAQRRGRKPEPWLMNAHQRRRELVTLARYRVENGLGLGLDAGWAHVIGNTLRVIEGQVTEQRVVDEATLYGLPPMSQATIEDVVRQLAGRYWAGPKLYSPAHAGSLLSLTSVEREESGVQKLEAIDEPADDRRRRLDRDRKREKRAVRAALSPKPMTKKDRAKSLGISRAELYRRLQSGEVEP